MQLAYEYAGGKSSPLPVAVDGPDVAETDAFVEYVGNPSSNSGSWFLIASTARSLVLPSADANSKRRPEQRTSALVPFVRPPSGEGEIDMARKFEPRSGCWKLVDIIEHSGTDKESKDGAVFPVFETSETKMNRWSVSHILPVLLGFLAPPEPPEVSDPDGGASGIVRLSSAPSIDLMIIS